MISNLIDCLTTADLVVHIVDFDKHFDWGMVDKGRDMVVDIDTAVVGKGRVVDTDKVVDMNMVECCTYIVD